MQTNEEQHTVDEMSEYIASFIAARFPEQLPKQLQTIISEIILDAFWDGARWAEAQIKEASPIITEI